MRTSPISMARAEASRRLSGCRVPWRRAPVQGNRPSVFRLVAPGKPVGRTAVRVPWPGDPLPWRGARRPDLRAPGRLARPRPTRSRRTSAARSPTSPSPRGAPGPRRRSPGAAGDDEWGRWLCERLEREGVDLRFFELLEGAQTPIAFATFDEDREPSFQIYGDAIEIAVAGRVARGWSRRSTRPARSSSARPRWRPRASARSPCAPASWRSSAGPGSASTPTSAPTAGAATRAPAAEASRELIEGSYLVRANRERGDRDRRRRRPARRRRRSSPGSAPSSRWSRSAPRAR